MKKRNEKKRVVWHVVGGITFAVGMLIVMPKFIEKGSDYIYKKNRTFVNPQDDDWGPEIVKKNTLEGDKDGEI